MIIRRTKRKLRKQREQVLEIENEEDVEDEEERRKCAFGLSILLGLILPNPIKKSVS